MVLRDLKTIYNLAKPKSGRTHAERMESFYKDQAEHYDDFRRKLLPNRSSHFENLTQLEPRGNWADLGAGTGLNLELLPLDNFDTIYLVDLSPSLLVQASHRCKKLSHQGIQIVEEDAIVFTPNQKLDLITFSFSLTMIPNWFQALDNALKLLKPGGLIAAIDFHIPRFFDPTNRRLQMVFAQHLWPMWFSWDNVHLSRDHLSYLKKHFDTLHVDEQFHRLPYIPLSQVPYYQFIGRKR